MARIEAPSAKAVFEEANLSPVSLGFDEDTEAYRSINGFLPDVVRSVNMQVDAAARPHDFPFSREVLQAASPWKTEEQITEQIEDQQGQIKNWVLLEAATRFVGRAVGRQRVAVGGTSPVKDRYEELKELRAETRDVALASLTTISQESKDPDPPEKPGPLASNSVPIVNTW